MLTFKSFLVEKKESKTPYGVIFKNDKVVFVGKAHEVPLKIDPELVEKIKEIGDKYGYWYEGNGGDVPTSGLLTNNKKDYKGSWDDKFSNSIEGYPFHFLYTLGANVDVNKQYDTITDKNKSIFDSILDHPEVGYLQKKFDKNTLTQFLKACSEKGIDFLELSKQTATKENCKRMLKKLESLMYPEKNWEKFPYKAGKVAQKCDIARNKFLLQQKNGVYVAGSGHLSELLNLDKSLKMIGGEKANQ